MSEWKMKDGTIRGYDQLGNKRREPSTFMIPWMVLIAVGIVLSAVGRWVL